MTTPPTKPTPAQQAKANRTAALDFVRAVGKAKGFTPKGKWAALVKGVAK